MRGGHSPSSCKPGFVSTAPELCSWRESRRPPGALAPVFSFASVWILQCVVTLNPRLCSKNQQNANNKQKKSGLNLKRFLGQCLQAGSLGQHGRQLNNLFDKAEEIIWRVMGSDGSAKIMGSLSSAGSNLIVVSILFSIIPICPQYIRNISQYTVVPI